MCTKKVLNAGNLIISARVSLYPKATNLKKFMKNSKDENTFDMTDIDNTIYNKNFTFTKQSISVGNIKNSLNEGLITDVGDYIEFYNHRRFHETLVYKKPMNVYQESIKLNHNNIIIILECDI
jgi:hypothetical protein